MTTAADPSRDATRRTQALTGLILDVFRLNGALLEAGDALVSDLGLTSARWQVLGAVALSPVPLPVAHVARNMGLSRQGVQRLVDDMRAEGLVRLDPNPHHRRALLVVLTEAGRGAFAAATARQRAWAEGLSAGLRPEAVETAAELLRVLERRLDEPAAGRADTTTIDEGA